MPSRRPPLDVETLWKLARVGTPALSPDGTRACVPVTTYDMEKNGGSTSLWLLPAKAGRGAAPSKLTAGDKDSAPVWSPDGRWIAFTAKRTGDDAPQVYVIAPDGGEARRVTSLSTGCSSLRWFPDGKRIAFVSSVWPDLDGDAAQAKRLKARREDKVQVHASERGELRFWDRWLTDGREPHVFAVDVASGRARDLLAGTGLKLPPWEPSAEDYDIAPDGREIAFVVDPADEPGMLNLTDIVTLELAGKRKRVVTGSSGRSDSAPRYSPDGASILHLTHDTARRHTDEGTLALVPRRGGAIRLLAPRFDRAPRHPQWSPDGGAVLFLAEDRGLNRLWRLDAGARDPRALTGRGTIGGFAQSGDGTTIAFDASTIAAPPAIYACAADGADLRRLDRFNDALLAKHAFGETREITVKGWGGEPVQCWLVFPPGFDPSRKWPLLHSIHGGPNTAHGDGWHFRWNAHVFAGWGYVVAMVNYHGSSSFGQAFTDSIVGRYGEKEFADIEASTDRLLRDGYIDRSRMAISGGSYGGYMAAYINGHTSRYAAHVCHAGCYDWVSMMATDGYRWFGRELGAWHWDDEKRVLAQSPHHFVGRAKSPTLVIHGEQDFRVPATQALQYYHTLKARDVPARLLWYPDENHWILKPRNSKRWYEEFAAWIRRYAPGGGRRR